MSGHRRKPGVALLKAGFSTSSSKPARGLAAYSLADDSAPVTMASLVPAGAVVLPYSAEDRSMQLRVTAGRKVIFRVWTARVTGTSSSSANLPYSLSLTFEERDDQEPGDVPETAVPLDSYPMLPDGSAGTYLSIRMPFLSYDVLTTEAADNLIGGTYYPGGSAFWYRWKSTRGDLVRLSVRDTFSWPSSQTLRFTSLMVVEQASPGGALSLVAGPSETLTFSPVPNKKYLVRIALSLPDADAPFEGITLQGGQVPLGDEYLAPLPLAPGGFARVMLTGARPANEPDVWFDMGNSLAGVFRVEVSDAQAVSVYRVEGGGIPTIRVGDGSEDVNFLAEAGSRYFARVFSPQGHFPGACTVSLLRQTATPPANDRRANSEVLSAAGQVLLYGDATGASIEESDWIGAPVSARREGRTVWYALDRPAGAQPWFVWAWNGGDAALYKEDNGSLVTVDDGWNRFVPDGSRTWIRVNADAKFILMAGPVESPGDDIADAVALIPGETRFVYTGASTGNSPAPGLPGPDTQWFSWTAEQSGSVVLSTRGSPSAQWKPAVYTAALAPVVTQFWTPDNQGSSSVVLSFDATAGTSYRIVLDGYLRQPAILRLQPGGWESPYDLWLQSYPAWKDVPSFGDPFADTDNDGCANVMEVALGSSLLDGESFNPPLSNILSDPQGFGLLVQEQAWALRGAPGSRPFILTLEGSSDLRNWAEVPHSVTPLDPLIIQHIFEWRPGAANDPPVRYFRWKVQR